MTVSELIEKLKEMPGDYVIELETYTHVNRNAQLLYGIYNDVRKKTISLCGDDNGYWH